MTQIIFRFAAFILFTVIAIAHPAYAGEPEKVKWTDLAPKTAPLKNPMEELTDDQMQDFGNIEYWLGRDPGLMDPDAVTERKEAKRLAKRSRRNLTKQGVNVDDLFDRYGKWQDELDRRRKLTVKKYNGKQISLAGYLLPLDFSNSGVKEFLLVPYVGACIHTPSPPANQIAFVRMSKPYKVKGLYDPVWVTGRMNSKPVSKNLSFTDGSSMVDAGYTLSGENISKYVRPKLPPLPNK